MSTARPKESESSKRDSAGKSNDFSGWWFDQVDKDSADFNQVTNSIDEQFRNTEEEKLSTQTSKYDGWWFEPAETDITLTKEEMCYKNNDVDVSASNDKQSQNCGESKGSKCSSSSVQSKEDSLTKISDELEKYQAALKRKFTKIYKDKEIAENNVKQEESYEFDVNDFDSDTTFTEDEFSDSDSEIDETD